MSLFSPAKRDQQIGVDFLSDGVAVVQINTSKKRAGQILNSDYLPAVGQPAQIEALQQWVRNNRVQKTSCVCLIASDDCDVYQVEKPDVDAAELSQALAWRIKDLIDYDVDSAVVDSYPMPVSSKNNKQQLSVVSAHESTVGSYVDSIKSAGLKLEAIDIRDLVAKNLKAVQQGAEQTQAILALAEDSGLLSIFHDGDLYVSRDFRIGLEQVEQANQDDPEVYDSLLLEIQRSTDYFESYYGLGSVTRLLVNPQSPATAKMMSYLQNASSFDIDFILSEADQESEVTDLLEPHCFHAYCAALRGVRQ